MGKKTIIFAKFRWSVTLLYLSFLSLSFLQAQTSSPPTLFSVVPNGGQRGETVEVLIDGSNLGNARRLLFNGPGLTASILKNDLLPNKPPKLPNQMTVIALEDPATGNRLRATIKVGSDVEPGIYGFRVLTPLGTTNLLPFAVGPFPEVEEKQINDDFERAQPLPLPATVRGEISQVGDVDYFAFEARAGQELVFTIVASALGSEIKSKLALLSKEGKVLTEADELLSGQDPYLIHRFTEGGTYLIRVADALMGSGDSHFYRLQAGEYSYLKEVFPLGVQAGQRTALRVRGANLEQNDREGASIAVMAEHSSVAKGLPISVPPALNKIRIAVGTDTEIMEHEPNNTAAAAQSIASPVTINGRIFDGSAGEAGLDEDWFKFTARKGQHFVIDVEAERLGSLLDSIVEVVDAQGKPVPLATLRPVAATNVQVDGSADSKGIGVMVDSWHDLSINDYLAIGNEVVQVGDIPRHPDDYLRLKSFLGRRVTSLNTTPEAHPGGTPIYKVQTFPPGTQFSPNGLPIFELDYSNDDGGPLHGSDSHLNFEAPEDGTFIVKIKDARGLYGERYAYRLTIREPRPDFRLLLGTFLIEGQFEQRRPNPANCNVPIGGQIPLTVVAQRIDGFNDAIEVWLEGLPPGVKAPPGVIPEGADSVTLLLTGSKELTFEPVPLKIVGRARVGDQMVTRNVDPERQLSLIAPSSAPDIRVSIDSPRIEIVPGQEVQFTVRVDRQNGFGGRVPIDLRNLPQGVRVLGVGLVGILVPKEQSERAFTLYAEPWVKPLRQPIYVVGRIETRSSVPLEHSSDPIELVILPTSASTR